MQTILYLDESILDSEFIIHLKKEGFKIETAITKNLMSRDDTIQIEFAFQNKFIFLTTDKRMELILKQNKRIPAIFIINQLLVQSKKFDHITKKIKYYLGIYSPKEIIDFGYI